MEADFEQHVVPSGAVCYYRDADHTYWRGIEPKKKRDPEGEWKGCGRLTGVSTASSPFDFNPDNLMRWAARTNGIGVAQLVNMILEAGEGVESFEWLRTAESIWTTLTEQGLTYADVRDARAEEGTNVHKHALYALATGKPVPDYHELTDAEQGYGSGVAAFWLEHFPEPLDAETVVMDLGLGVAGRLDLRARLRARCGRPACPCQALRRNGIALIDAKTSGYIPNKHHVQIAGYEHCARVSGLGISDAEWILQVDAEGGWELIPVRASARDFELAVDVYRRSARIAKEAKADRKAREEAMA